MDTPSAQERGTALEERLLRLFESQGYQASQNVRLLGRSGVVHQIDVYAHLTGPLHTSKLIVEAKSQDAAVDKDRVMKLIQIVGDLGADRGILVTTSHFTTSAIRTAEGHGIDLWDHEKLAQLLGEIEVSSVVDGLPRNVETNRRALQPQVPVEAICERLRQNVRKRARGFMGIGRVDEDLYFCRLTYYPYYNVELERQQQESQRRAILKKETVHTISTFTVSVDAFTGCLVQQAKSGVSYEFAFTGDLTKDEVRLLRAAGKGQFSNSALAFLGLSDARLRKSISRLITSGCLTQTNARPRTYRVVKPIPDLATLVPITKERDATQGSSPGAIVSPLREAVAVMHALESYWDFTTARSVLLVYYPFILAEYRTPNGKRRPQLIDAITGEVNTALSGFVRGLEIQMKPASKDIRFEE